MRWRGSKGHELRAAEQCWWRRFCEEVKAVSDWWIRVLRAERVVMRLGFGGTMFDMLESGFWGKKVNEWGLGDGGGGGGFMVSAESVSRLKQNSTRLRVAEGSWRNLFGSDSVVWDLGPKLGP